MKKQIFLLSLIAMVTVIPLTINAQGGTVLFVVGDDNRTVVPGQGTGDLFIRDRLEKMGLEVILGIDSSSLTSLWTAAESADLVIVSESTTSMRLRNKLKTVTSPIINYEAFIQDEMGFTPLEPSGDPGEPEDFEYGVSDNRTEIDIVMPGHPLAAGLEGTVKIYKETRQVSWGKIGGDAMVIATLPGKKIAASIYLYEKGAGLFDGSEASGMRIGFFLEEENITGTSNFMTEDGLKLFDTAVKFALSSGQ